MGKEKYIRVIDGTYWARVTYKDQNGKKHDLLRRADNKTHAKQIAQQLLQQIAQHGTQAIDASNMTFDHLIDHYRKNYAVAPEYADNTKIVGLRSHKKINFILVALSDYFGKKKLRTITGADLQAYKIKRLNTPTRLNKKRSITSVNRELAILRRIFNIAHREGWLLKNPFNSTEKLIAASQEIKRSRVLSKEEEKILLDHCVGLRAHLKAILICALDTGMRAGEIFSLTWADVNLDQRLITVKALNTKTLQSRQIALTARLYNSLSEIYKVSDRKPGDTIFTVKSVKRSFGTLLDIAGIKDLRFHDLRHTAATRLIQQGLSLQEVGRILGHTQANTTYRYINLTVDTAKRAASALDQFHNSGIFDQKEEKDEYIS